MIATTATVTESEVPKIGFTSAGLRALSTALIARADGVQSDATALISGWGHVGDHYKSPHSDSLLARVPKISAPITAYVDAHSQLGRMLGFAANLFVTFEQERRALLNRIVELRSRAASLHSDANVCMNEAAQQVHDQKVRDATNENEQLRSAIASFGLRLQQDKENLARAIARIDGGTGAGLSAVSDTPKLPMTERFDQALGTQTQRLLDALAKLPADKLAPLAALHHDWLRLVIDNAPTAGEVGRWWDSLSDLQRAALIAGVPLVVGNLNGIAEGARIMANKRNLQARISHLRFMKDEGLLSDDELTELKNLNELNDTAPRLYDTNGKRIDSLTGGEQLLAFDPDKQAIATYRGPIDPVTGRIPADLQNLAFFTPGTNSDLNGVAGNVTVSARIADAHPGRTAVIFWQGGVFPKAQGWPVDLSTLSAHDGEVLGEKYAEFANSISTGDGTRITSVNHSYGNIIYSEAEMSGFRPDAHVALAGEGMGHLTDAAGKFVGDPGVSRYSLIAPGDDIVGKNGVAGWAVNTAYPSQQWEDSNYTDLETGSADGHEITGHDLSGLLSNRSESLDNVQKVIEGDTANTTEQHNRSKDLTGAR